MYLNDALRILDKLTDSNDPETFGLKGAIYKRLSKINDDNIGYLDRAIENYEKGYMINYDFYTGENLAFCFDKKSSLLNDNDEENNSKNSLILTYDRATGGFLPIQSNAWEQNEILKVLKDGHDIPLNRDTSSLYCQSITVSGGMRTRVITLNIETGKYSVEAK